jgi:hypothetical protein
MLGILTFWEILVLVFLLSSINTQGDTGRYGLVPSLAQKAGMTRVDKSIISHQVPGRPSTPRSGVLVSTARRDC